MDLKCVVCFLTLVVGITAYSSSSDASSENLAGGYCVGACLEDQSDPQLMLVQRQANRRTEVKAFEKAKDLLQLTMPWEAEEQRKTSLTSQQKPLG
jgi:hypothetical protein